MEMKLLCAAVLLVLVSTLTGIDAQSDVCGTAPLNTRIVGGQDAAEGAWPWQVSIHISNRFTCGGSLINNQWVLTAAHCLDRTSISVVTVYPGRHTQSGPNPNEQRRTVSQIIGHPEYNSSSFNNDIALVKLSSPVTFNNYIRPVCLAAADSVYINGTNTWVTGWGDIQTNESLPPNMPLQEVDISVVSNSECSEVYELITVNMICAGVSSGRKGPCKGDSGGPMMTKTGSRWVQGGVVSFGIKDCALPKSPSVFTRVSQYESWINSEITTNQPGFITFSPSPPSSASSSVGPATGVILTVLLSVYVLS